MRILVVSNFYPPHHIGGYEMGCREVVDRLRGRGHDVRVLTGTYGVPRPVAEGHVHRELTVVLRPAAGMRQVVALVRKERVNQRAFRRHVRGFAPDLIYFWNPSYGIGTLLNAAAATRLPLVCFVSDGWVIGGSGLDPVMRVLASKNRKWTHRAARLTLRAALAVSGCLRPDRPPALRRVQFASRFLERLSAPVLAAGAVSEVIHWGIDADRFSATAKAAPPARVLYVGRLDPSKGVHTAVEGFLRVAEKPGNDRLSLTVVGDGKLDPEYERYLRDRAGRSPAGARVTFAGPQPPPAVAEAYSTHDVLLFPSEWEEPFSIALLEAMASGLAVVGTLTGGTSEVLVDGETGVTFRAGDPDDLGRGLERLVGDAGLYSRVAAAAAAIVRRRHTLDDMVDRVEASLKAAIPPGAT